MKSESHKAFGAGARNCRFTRSRGDGVDLSLCVVFTVLARTVPANPHALHQPSNLATRRGDGLALKLPPDLAHAVDLEVRVPDPLDVDLQVRITPRPGRQFGGIGALGCMLMVGGRGDRQDLADRLDPMRLAVTVDERDHGLDRRQAPLSQNTPTPCAGSRWPGGVRAPRVPGP